MAESRNVKKESDKKKQQEIQLKLKKFRRGAVFCIGLGVVLFLLCSYVLFKVGTITVEGVADDFCKGTHKHTNSCYYTDEEIIRMCGVSEGESLVLISKDEIEATIENLLPYIGNVEVKRQYPSTLKLIVEDTHAQYAADAGGGYTLLDKNFKALERTEDIPSYCAKLIGVHLLSAELGEAAAFEDESCKSKLSSIEDYCEKSGLMPITKIDIVNIVNISFTVADRYTIVLGSMTDLTEKFNAAVNAINAENEKGSSSRQIINVVDPKRAYVGADNSPLDDKSDDSDEIIAVG